MSKRRVTGSGKATGGLPFSRGALFQLLRNWLDLGEIPHREMCHPGLHEAIIDRALFEAVQQKLDAHVRRRAKARETVAHAPLTGRIFDADGQVMSPAFAYGRGGKLYRYYVLASLQHGGRRAKGDEAPRRVSAAALDARRLATLGRLLTEHSGPPLLLITRVELHATRLELLPIRSLARMRSHLLPGESADADPADPSQLRLSLPVRFLHLLFLVDHLFLHLLRPGTRLLRQFTGRSKEGRPVARGRGGPCPMKMSTTTRCLVPAFGGSG